MIVFFAGCMREGKPDQVQPVLPMKKNTANYYITHPTCALHGPGCKISEKNRTGLSSYRAGPLRPVLIRQKGTFVCITPSDQLSEQPLL